MKQDDENNNDHVEQNLFYTCDQSINQTNY